MGWAPPVPAQQQVIVSLEAGRLSALEAGSWRQLWRFPESDSRCPDAETGEEVGDLRLQAIYGAPVVTASTVYLGAYDSRVYALDRQTGDCLWTFDTGGPIIGGLALDETAGILLVPSDDGRVYGLDPATGRPRPGWPFQTGKGVWARPLIDQGVAYIVSLDRHLYAVDLATGRELWRYEARGGLISDPVLADGLLLVGGFDRRLYAIDVRTRAPAWAEPFRADNWFWAAPVVAGGTVYAANLDGRLYALRLTDGQLLWIQDVQQPVRARPLLASGPGVLIAINRDGQAYGFDPTSGSPRWGPVEIGATVLASPVPIDGAALVNTQPGGLYRLDPASGALSRVVQPS